ncbi:MAG: tRNA (adenosine(37)-N6)-threonylcarbamoyltransferase complex dimerization subunit type 1 TsaB [Phycisphaerales bacterium]|nr:tRNA (adenosine(37)-N6)-threonylcarbamoyltransferase complex dimerization subunit type 1 TsaB [Phycisphaerales bacterium]
MFEKKIVAIETSGRQGSVVVALGERIIGERVLSPTLRHAVELMPAIEAMVAEAGWEAKEIEQVYLSLGPGSFTGLRIAVAVARGFAQAIGCRVVGVPSLDVIAANAAATTLSRSAVGGSFKVVVPILDAKRGEVFAARYESDEAGRLVQTKAAGLVRPEEFVREAVEVAGGGRVAVLGEGVDYHREAILAGGGTELPRELWAGRASVVHRLGWEKALRGEFSDQGALLPIYIRLPEAEEVWRRKHGVE